MRARVGASRATIDYQFTFTQAGAVVFESRQLGVFLRVDDE